MDDREQHIDTTRARAGTTPHMTRVILPISLALVVISSACNREPEPAPAVGAGGPPAPRYWLRRATVRSEPAGGEARSIEGPVLVELLPGGRVRSPAGSIDSIDGYLDPKVAAEPGDRLGRAHACERSRRAVALIRIAPAPLMDGF